MKVIVGKTILRKKSVVVFILALLFVSCSDKNNPVDPPKSVESVSFAKIYQLVDSFCNETNCIGISIGVLKGGNRIYYSKGYASLETKQPANENTIYEIASVSKSFTGFLIATLYEQSKISLDSEINGLTELKIPSYQGTGIKIRDLLSHTSGLEKIPDNLTDAEGYNVWNPYKNYTVELLNSYLGSTSLLTKPGTTYKYSNTGYAILGHLAEELYTKKYDFIIQKLICDPLGMSDTRISLNEEQLKRFANGYYSDGKLVQHWDAEVFKGAMAVKSTAKDLLSYIEGNLGIRANQLSTTFNVTHMILNSGYGFGWYVSGNGADKIFHHDGLSYGFNSKIKFSANKQIGLVILSNHSLYFNSKSKNIYSLFDEIWNEICR